MELIAIIILAALLPIMSITAFIIGYNVNAQRKIMQIKKPKKAKPTEDEIMLDRINKATI